MKKFLLVVMSIVMLVCSLAVCAFAQTASGGFTNIEVDGESVCFVKNEYYRINSDRILGEFYNKYQALISGLDGGNTYYQAMYKNESLNRKISDDLYNSMLTSGDIYYLSVILNYDGEVSAEKNTNALKETKGKFEVIYVATATPCAVIELTSADEIAEVIGSNTIKFTALFCSNFLNTYLEMVNDEYGSLTFSPTAADARKILRYAAKLDGVPETNAKKFFITSDTDFDGKITASDARTALRIAAGLEKGHFYKSFSASVWGAD